MNFENIELFIKSGIIAHEKQQYKSFIAGSGIVGILGSAVASFFGTTGFHVFNRSDCDKYCLYCRSFPAFGKNAVKC